MKKFKEAPNRRTRFLTIFVAILMVTGAFFSVGASAQTCEPGEVVVSGTCAPAAGAGTGTTADTSTDADPIPDAEQPARITSNPSSDTLIWRYEGIAVTASRLNTASSSYFDVYQNSPHELLPVSRWGDNLTLRSRVGSDDGLIPSADGTIATATSSILTTVASIEFTLAGILWSLLLELAVIATTSEVIESQAENINNMMATIPSGSAGLVGFAFVFGLGNIVYSTVKANSKGRSGGIFRQLIVFFFIFSLLSGATSEAQRAQDAGLTGPELVSNTNYLTVPRLVTTIQRGTSAIGSQLSEINISDNESSGYGGIAYPENTNIEPSCETFTDELISRYTSGQVGNNANGPGGSNSSAASQSAAVTAVNDLWMATQYKSWLRAQWGDDAAREEGARISCHIFEHMSDDDPVERQTLYYAVYGEAGADVWPNGRLPAATSVVFGDLPEDNPEREAATFVWSMCQWTPGGVTLNEALWPSDAGIFSETGGTQLSPIGPTFGEGTATSELTSFCDEWFNEGRLYEGGGNEQLIELGAGNQLQQQLIRTTGEVGSTVSNGGFAPAFEVVDGYQTRPLEKVMHGAVSLIVSLMMFGALIGPFLMLLVASIGSVVLLMFLPLALIAWVAGLDIGPRMVKLTFILSGLSMVVAVVVNLLIQITNLASFMLAEVLPGGGSMAVDLLIAAVPLFVLFVLNRLMKSAGLGSIMGVKSAMDMGSRAVATAENPARRRQAPTGGAGLGGDGGLQGRNLAPGERALAGIRSKLSATPDQDTRLGRALNPFVKKDGASRLPSMRTLKDGAKLKGVGALAGTKGLLGSRVGNKMVKGALGSGAANAGILASLVPGGALGTMAAAVVGGAKGYRQRLNEGSLFGSTPHSEVLAGVDPSDISRVQQNQAAGSKDLYARDRKWGMINTEKFKANVAEANSYPVDAGARQLAIGGHFEAEHSTLATALGMGDMIPSQLERAALAGSAAATFGGPIKGNADEFLVSSYGVVLPDVVTMLDQNSGLLASENMRDHPLLQHVEFLRTFENTDDRANAAVNILMKNGALGSDQGIATVIMDADYSGGITDSEIHARVATEHLASARNSEIVTLVEQAVGQSKTFRQAVTHRVEAAAAHVGQLDIDIERLASDNLQPIQVEVLSERVGRTLDVEIAPLLAQQSQELNVLVDLVGHAGVGNSPEIARAMSTFRKAAEEAANESLDLAVRAGAAKAAHQLQSQLSDALGDAFKGQRSLKSGAGLFPLGSR